MKHERRGAPLTLVWIVVFLILVVPLARAERAPIALLAVRNYSGTTKAGTVDLETRVPNLVIELFNKGTSEVLWPVEQTRKKLAEEGLSEFYQVINLCTQEDYRRIGSRIGAGKVAFIEIHGYGEIKREKQKKTYQVQLGLVILDCQSGEERTVTAEGFGDSVAGSLENAAKNLVSGYLSQPAEANLGNKRDENLPVIANVESNRYHLPDCRHLPRPELRRDYPARKTAEADGFLPCPICYPRFKSGSVFDRSLEERLGRTACGEIEYYYRLDHDPEVLARIERVAAPLLADTTRYHVNYRFRYLDEDALNAFGAPNGYIYITRGLMEAIESDDELAFVIAHEMGHIEHKHAVVRYRQAMALAVLGALFGSQTDSSGEALMVAVIVEILLKGFSREQELEADETAISHLKHAGMDATAYRTLMGRLMDLRERRVLALEAVFGTHPAPENRIKNLDEILAVYQSFQAKLSS